MYIFICLQAHGKTLIVMMIGMQVVLLIAHKGPLHDVFPLEIYNVAVVVEKRFILHDLRDVFTGYAMLICTI